MKKQLTWFLAALLVAGTALPAMAKGSPPAHAGGARAKSSEQPAGGKATGSAAGGAQVTSAPTNDGSCPDAGNASADQTTPENTTTEDITTENSTVENTTTENTETENTETENTETENTETENTETENTETNTGTDTGATNHQAAVAKVMVKLCSKLSWMNPKAAANVQDVLYRMEATLQADPTMTPTATREAVKAALKARKVAHTAAAQELDVLAAVEAEDGELAAAAATLEERVRKGPGARQAYERLGALYAQLGTEPLQTLVDGKKPAFDVKPFVKSGRTLVPLRAITEALGAQVGWNPETRVVTITRGDTTLELQIGSNTVTVNGEPVQIEAAAAIEQGRTVVPVRLVSEALGLYVNWLEEGKVIVITSEPLTDGTTTTTGE